MINAADDESSVYRRSVYMQRKDNIVRRIVKTTKGGSHEDVILHESRK